MSIGSDIAARFLLERAREEAQRRERIAAAIAAGPPAGVTAKAWRDWHRYGFVACPGRKGDRTCDLAECGIGAACAVMAAKGLHGDGTPMERKDRPRCGARTRAGGNCAMRVEPGKHRCRLHGGLSTGPRTEQGRKRLSERMKALWARRKAGAE